MRKSLIILLLLACVGCKKEELPQGNVPVYTDPPIEEDSWTIDDKVYHKQTSKWTWLRYLNNDTGLNTYTVYSNKNSLNNLLILEFYNRPVAGKSYRIVKEAAHDGEVNIFARDSIRDYYSGDWARYLDVAEKDGKLVFTTTVPLKHRPDGPMPAINLLPVPEYETKICRINLSE